MLLHETFEKASAPFLVVHDLLLQCRYRQRTYVAQREGSGHRNSQREPLDVAVEFLCEQKSGAQGRVREVMLFDWHKDRLETHGDLHSCRSSPRRARIDGVKGAFSAPFGSLSNRRARLAVLRQLVEHAFEVLGLAEVAIDRRKAHVSNVVERAQRL